MHASPSPAAVSVREGRGGGPGACATGLQAQAGATSATHRWGALAPPMQSSTGGCSSEVGGRARAGAGPAQSGGDGVMSSSSGGPGEGENTAWEGMGDACPRICPWGRVGWVVGCSCWAAPGQAVLSPSLLLGQRVRGQIEALEVREGVGLGLGP